MEIDRKIAWQTFKTNAFAKVRHSRISSVLSFLDPLRLSLFAHSLCIISLHLLLLSLSHFVASGVNNAYTQERSTSRRTLRAKCMHDPNELGDEERPTRGRGCWAERVRHRCGRRRIMCSIVSGWLQWACFHWSLAFSSPLLPSSLLALLSLCVPFLVSFRSSGFLCGVCLHDLFYNSVILFSSLLFLISISLPFFSFFRW